MSLLRFACIIGALFTPLSASIGQDTFLVCDSSRDAVYRLRDSDLNGTIDPAVEVNIYYDDTSDGPDLSTPNHLLPYREGVLLSDGGTLDAILFLRDLNADGDANDPGEVTPFYDDSAPGIDLSIPNAVVASPDGTIFVADDGSSVQAVLQLRDLNDDRDANDDGESLIFYDTTALSPAEPITDPESLVVTSNGIVFIGDSSQGRVLRLEDLNGDADALDAGEARVFYEGAQPAALTDIDALVSDPRGGIYAVDEDTGTVVYLVDGNGDGDALDSGEARLFLDGSAPGAIISDPNEAIWLGGGLLFADGGVDALVRAEDLDGDGNASGPGEITFLFDDGGNLLSSPSGIAFIPGVVVPAPVLDSIQPSSGPVTGGTAVTLFGSNLTGTLAVRFGAVPAVTFQVVDDFSVQAESPAAANPGAVTVSVETPGGGASLVDGFVYTTSTGALFIRGDTVADGIFRIGDAIFILNYLFVPPTDTSCPDALDVNDDQIIQIEDALMLLEYLFLGGPPPQPPFPDPGPDPTPGGPGCDP